MSESDIFKRLVCLKQSFFTTCPVGQVSGQHFICPRKVGNSYCSYNDMNTHHTQYKFSNCCALNQFISVDDRAIQGVFL